MSLAVCSGTGRISRPVNRRRSVIRLARRCRQDSCENQSGGCTRPIEINAIATMRDTRLPNYATSDDAVPTAEDMVASFS
jgi:hypothetical protein